ncbi:MAG TPA: polysaccharide deacetylase family protein [Acidobacteriaceae bacterium]|nr:polysaccharide deacetylase family protein [Acidobacteriaceae bacterium]
MLKVLITIDTETHPIAGNWKQDRLAADMKRDVYGQIDGNAVGLEYQLSTLAKQNLKASFFVESLFAAVPEVGEQPLRDIVCAITPAGHDVQLHPHPEWVQYLPGLDVPHRSHLLSAYSLDEQAAIMRYASLRLEQAGAPRPVAFRAGGFAANTDTLLALENCGIRYDSSYNRSYLGDRCRLPQPRFVGHLTDYNGVQELPVAVFQDFMGHFRPAQLCACSADEMIHALVSAEAAGWEFFVIVSHSFEMLARRRHPSKQPVIRWDVVERFERLCQFLGSNTDRFPTIRFTDLDTFSSMPMPDAPEISIKGKFLNTVSRIAAQAFSRIQTH